MSVTGSGGPLEGRSLGFKVAFYTFWCLILPIGVGFAVVSLRFVADPEVSGVLTAVLATIGAVIIAIATWWFLRLRAEQRRRGTWKAAIRAGLATGAVMVLVRIGREVFGG